MADNMTQLDKQVLKKLEGDFFLQFPQGFSTPELAERIKKHNVDKMTALSHECFNETACANVYATADNMVKVIGRSSLISMFEKPKFRDFVKQLNDDDKVFLVNSLKEILHGNQQLGFEAMTDILRTEKLAKWSLLTVIPNYYYPTKEVFVKPTTAKGILKYFEITDPLYKPAPTWDFYKKYCKLIMQGKKSVAKELAPSNVAFSGFLMMSVPT